MVFVVIGLFIVVILKFEYFYLVVVGLVVVVIGVVFVKWVVVCEYG